MPRPLGPARAHYWLVQRMARATGADPAGAWAEGRLSASEWKAMVERCRSCEEPDRCLRWLEARELQGGAPDAARPRCRNRDRLAELADTSTEASQT